MFAGSAVCWFLASAWFPVIRTSIHSLPAESEIRGGVLAWTGESPQRIAENRFLAVAVDLDLQGEARSPSMVQIEFGRFEIRLSCLYGSLRMHYPKGRKIAFSREELEPRWGAWAPELLAGSIVVVCSLLVLVWMGLGFLFAGPAWMIGFFANRELNWRDARRLCGAALMPGSLIMTMAVVFLGLGAIDLIQFAGVFAVHLVIGLIYSIGAPFYLPRNPSILAVAKNPFSAQDESKVPGIEKGTKSRSDHGQGSD
jgi:hypothetical protein